MANTKPATIRDSFSDEELREFINDHVNINEYSPDFRNLLFSFLKEENRTLKEKNQTDFLTKLPNREGLFHDFKNLEENKPKSIVGVCYLDVDNFKVINDTYGHSIGDSVLETLADIFSKHSRPGDRVYRTGGDEIVALLQSIGRNTQNTEQAAHESIERFRKEVEQYNWRQIHADLCSITISAGFVAGPVTTGLNVMLGQADKALYVAKEIGKNKVVPFTAIINEKREHGAIKS